MRHSRTIRTAAFAASLAAWCGWGMMEAKAQADAWAIGNDWARMEGVQSGNTIATAALPTPGGAYGYNGTPATRSQHIRTNGAGRLIFFAIDGRLYDGDGYLIADNRGAGCQQCLEHGVMEFVSVPIPGHCGLYYLFAARPKTQFAIGFIQMAILDMNLDNTAYGNAPPGACNARKGRLLELSEEVWNLYPQLDVWGGLGYIWENTNVDPVLEVPTSLYVSRLDQEDYTKSQSPIIRVVQGEAAGDPILLFAIMSTEVLVYSITSQGISRVNTVAAGLLEPYAFGYLPLWYPYDADWTDKQYKYDADARRLPDGSIRVAVTANYGMYALPDIDETYNLLTMRFNAANGMWIPGSTEGYRIHPPPNGCTSTAPGISQAGLVGCSISSAGNEILLSGEFTDDCVTWFPLIGKQVLGNGALIDLTANIPGAASLVRSRFYRNRVPGSAQEGMYIPHSTGIALVTNWEGTGSAALQTPPLPGATPPVFAGNTPSYYMPRFLNTSVQGDTHLSTTNLTNCCSYFQTVPGAVAGGFTRTAGTSTWNGATNEAQPGSNVVVFNCDVIVEPGGRLFASNMTWKFTENAKVIVKPGGYLDLNNCTLTSISCTGARWPGVEVWGNAFYNQSISSGSYPAPTYQGKLNATNSTIENAQIGVLAGRRSAQTGFTATPYEGGGIVTMNGGAVKNCERGVDFRKYPEFTNNTSLPAPNQSRFTGTQFLLNQTQGGVFTFTAHARLDRVNGIQFKQCAFKNTVADAWYAAGSNPLGSVRLGYGIESYQSEFKVWPGCNTLLPLGQDCPAANVLPTVFEGLDHGIHALGGPNALRNFSVDRATFTTNICGVYTSGVHNFITKRSTFSLGNRNVPMTNLDESGWALHHRGIYSYTGYGFIVEDNTLVQAGTNPTEGIVIGLSGDHNDMVFRNNATNLERGYIGEGICVDLNERAVKGLHFQCNQNTDNETNFWSRYVNGGGDADDQTIRTNQGRSNRPADNTFDQELSRIDFANDGCPNNQISYWWANPDVPYKPIYVSSDPVTGACVTESNEFNGVLITRPVNNCASRLSRVPGPVIGPVQLAQIVEDEKLAYADARYLYQQLIDGGNRDEVLTEIMSSWPQDAWELRQFLLDLSPYLTVEVLQDVVNKPGFPMAMKAEVCIANPDATRSEGFVRWLEYEAVYTMTPSMIASIVASWETRTFRTQLENTLADHHGEMTQAADLWLEELSKDTINDPLDSLRMVWQEVRSPGARYAEAISYLQIGDFAAAEAVVEAIPEEHELRPGELDERGRMLALIDFMEAVVSDNRNEESLTEGEQDALEGLVSTHADRPAVWGQNMLCFHYGRCTPPITGGENEPKSSAQRTKPVVVVEEGAIVVLPNPATSWTELVISQELLTSTAEVVLLDVTGKEVMRNALKENQARQLVDTRALAPGAYQVVLLEGDRAIATERLVVQP